MAKHTTPAPAAAITFWVTQECADHGRVHGGRAAKLVVRIRARTRVEAAQIAARALLAMR